MRATRGRRPIHTPTGVQISVDILPIGIGGTRDALPKHSWLFPDAGAAWHGVKVMYVAGSASPTHFVDVTDTIDVGVASLREHKVYLDGLGGDMDPDDFLRKMAGFVNSPFAASFRSSSSQRPLWISNSRVRDAFVASVAWTLPPVRRHSR